MKKLWAMLLIAFMIVPIGAAGNAEAASHPDGLIPSALIAIDSILEALNDDIYTAGYEAIARENVVSGSRGEGALALQTALIALGQDIAADGAAGPITFNALHKVQAEFDSPETDDVDAESYANLLAWLVVSRDGENARDTLSALPEGEFDYILGCVYAQKRLYYSARLAFERSGLEGSAARAEACIQPWDPAGFFWKRTEGGASRNAALTVRAGGVKPADAENEDKSAASDEGEEKAQALIIKVFDSDGRLADLGFIPGVGEAYTTLPAGDYAFVIGTGTNYYGPTEAFGPEGVYEELRFDGAHRLTLNEGERTILLIDTQEGDPDAITAGASPLTYEDFLG